MQADDAIYSFLFEENANVDIVSVVIGPRGHILCYDLAKHIR